MNGSLVEDFAARLAARLGVPYRPIFVKVGATRPQKDLTSNEQKRSNVRNAYRCLEPVIEGNFLVVDDVYDSGMTLGEIGRRLKDTGASRLFALAVAKTRHSDDQ